MNEPRYAELPLAQLSEPSEPHRESMDPDELHRLADSMAANGLHQAAAARGPLADGTWEIIWGHRRLIAARILRWPTLHCRIYPADTDPLRARLDENNIRADLSPLEEARQVHNVFEAEKSLSATARYFRRSTTWVDQRLELLTYPKDLQDAVHSGRIGIGVAARLVAIDDDACRLNYTQEAERTGATIATVEVWKQHWISDGARLRANFHTVEEIAARREKYIHFVACDTCREPVDFTLTKALRMCIECEAAVLDLIDKAAAEAATQARQ